MVDSVEWVPEHVWADIVKHAPIPSVDLVVQFEEGVLLAKRQNEPAKGEWFVPGGRIQKGEQLHEAVQRVAGEELGVSVSIQKELGAYNHLYRTADVEYSGGKHYVANGYLVAPDTESITLDEQHEDARVFAVDELPDLHPYVKSYLHDAGIVPEPVDQSPHE